MSLDSLYMTQATTLGLVQGTLYPVSGILYRTELIHHCYVFTNGHIKARTTPEQGKRS